MGLTVSQNEKLANSKHSSKRSGKGNSLWSTSEKESFVREMKQLQSEVNQKVSSRTPRFDLRKIKVKMCA